MVEVINWAGEIFEKWEFENKTHHGYSILCTMEGTFIVHMSPGNLEGIDGKLPSISWCVALLRITTVMCNYYVLQPAIIVIKTNTLFLPGRTFFLAIAKDAVEKSLKT